MTYAVIGAVCAVTVLLGLFGLRMTRSTSDFYVASRRVSPWMNASAVAGEYLSAASFLGVVGVIYALGADGLWLPVGYTAGFLVLLLFVAAPLRRSGAYTLPDFIVLRFRSVALRRVTAAVVVVAAWLYVMPQLYGAALVVEFSTGLPGWTGAVLVTAVVLVVVLSGGMRSVTVAQAVQYWIKLAALLIPAVFIALRWGESSSGDQQLSLMMRSPLDPADPLIAASLLLALSVGAMGLPHVLVRFYTNPDGQAARRTAAALVILVGVFYLIAVFLGIVAAGVLDPLGQADTAVLRLPGAVLEGASAQALTAMLVGGAFAAFLSTTSGLVVSASGVISQELFRGSVSGFRIGAVAAVVVPLVLATITPDLPLAEAVAQVFTFAASTVAPVIVLGIWWSRVTSAGALAGMATGGVSSAMAWAVSAIAADPPTLMAYPGLWSIPLAFAVIVVVSLFTDPPASTTTVLTKLHLPESGQQLRPVRGSSR